VRYMYYKENMVVLVWPGVNRRADRGLTRPTGVFRTTIRVCKIVSRSVEIWQYEGKKIYFGLAVNKKICEIQLMQLGLNQTVTAI